MAFIKSTVQQAEGTPTAYFFIFSNTTILVKQISETAVTIPCVEKAFFNAKGLESLCFLGTFQGRDCYCGSITADNLPDSYSFINIRSLYKRVTDIFWHMAGYARQIYDWNTNFKFCGRCGTKTLRKTTEHARVCPSCDLHHYPRISAAIIVAIVKGNQLLLARGINFPDKTMFSVLAGFVAPGETLEECIQREVFEEVGIQVRNITYFKSQSWPFPDSLMIGFTADHDSGDISIDPSEILEAGWFDTDHLPKTPGKYTLAGELIDWFVHSKGPRPLDK